MPQTNLYFSTTIRAALVIAAVAIMAACSDPLGLQATDETQTSVISLYALSGTPPGYPSALSVPANQAVTIDGNLLFDVAFDFDAQGHAVLYPMKLVAWPRLQVHSVGLFKSTQLYNDLTHAPTSGFTYDEATIVVVGDVFVIESNDERVCTFPYPARMYAKFVIDGIDLSARALRLRMTQNPNCGFRSFLSGIPQD